MKHCFHQVYYCYYHYYYHHHEENRKGEQNISYISSNHSAEYPELFSQNQRFKKKNHSPSCVHAHTHTHNHEHTHKHRNTRSTSGLRGHAHSCTSTTTEIILACRMFKHSTKRTKNTIYVSSHIKKKNCQFLRHPHPYFSKIKKKNQDTNIFVLRLFDCMYSTSLITCVQTPGCVCRRLHTNIVRDMEQSSNGSLQTLTQPMSVSVHILGKSSPQSSYTLGGKRKTKSIFIKQKKT